MKNKRRFGNILLAMAAAAVIIAGAARADGAASGPLRLSVDGAVEFAMKNSPMLAMSRADARAAFARMKMAVSQRRPQLSTTAFLSDGDMGGISGGPASVMPAAQTAFLPGRYYNQNVMLMLPLDVSGGLSKKVRAASREAGAAAHAAEAARQDLALEVRMWYYETLYAEERERIYEKAHENAVEQLSIDKAMVEAGKEPAYYVERARAEASMTELDHAEMVMDAVNARVALLAMLGLGPDDDVELTGELTAPALDSGPTVLPADTPDLDVYRQRAAAAKAAHDAARVAYFPDVALTFMADRVSMPDEETMNGTAAAIIVAVPIGDGGMRRSTVAETAAMSDAAAQELRSREIRLKADFRKARVEFLTALKNIETADFALKAAEENYRVAKIRYEAGKGILVEMLDAREALTAARVMRLDALRGALLARDMLLRLSGKL